MGNYLTEKENRNNATYKNTLLMELKSAPTKISDLEIKVSGAGNCSCPSCDCPSDSESIYAASTAETSQVFRRVDLS